MRHLIILILLFAKVSFAQQNENPNRVYEKFSEAYATLNADILLDCYTEDGTLLNLYDGSNPTSIISAANIRTYFTTFFRQYEGSGKSLRLSFKITGRETIGKMIYDNGYYMLEVISDGQLEHSGYGKLSTILQFVDGSWKFKVDSNTNTDKAEFQNAEIGSIPQPKAE